MAKMVAITLIPPASVFVLLKPKRSDLATFFAVDESSTPNFLALISNRYKKISNYSKH